ncbi:hypothetical protein [Natronorubrum halophilum]|uniref:hypothetical protein n=1 Tax=Natronorubrum halophilum TaxID=1702106 RepID=UPI0010C23CB6|nr:hypothetical protein [Natronorubrum halophilum]
MAVAQDEQWPEDRIQADLEERQHAETVAGPGGVRADGGSDKDNAHASRVAEQPEMADGGGGNREPIDVGDHVQDEQDPDATMVVVGLDTLRADAYELKDSGPTVADVNPEYPTEDDVVEVIYPQRTDLELEGKKRYAFPKSRLEVVARVHDRNEDDGGEE